jgi:hypothetical protein
VYGTGFHSDAALNQPLIDDEPCLDVTMVAAGRLRCRLPYSVKGGSRLVSALPAAPRLGGPHAPRPAGQGIRGLPPPPPTRPRPARVRRGQQQPHARQEADGSNAHPRTPPPPSADPTHAADPPPSPSRR